MFQLLRVVTDMENVVHVTLISIAISRKRRVATPANSKRKSLATSWLRWWKIGWHYTRSRSVSLLVHRVQFVITRVILPVEPPGKNRVLRGGDLSCSRQRAMKGASLFIGSAGHASYERCVLNVYEEKLDVALGESSAKYNIISLRLRKHTYASS